MIAGSQMPTLELDDGAYHAEVTAICEYLEELHPTPVLIGATPRERAEMLVDRRSERYGRLIDGEGGGSMESKKTEGYF